MKLIDKRQIMRLLELKLTGMKDSDKIELSKKMDKKGLIDNKITESTNKEDKIDYLVQVCELFDITKEDLQEMNVLQPDSNLLNEQWTKIWKDRL